MIIQALFVTFFPKESFFYFHKYFVKIKPLYPLEDTYSPFSSVCVHVCTCVYLGV